MDSDSFWAGVLQSRVNVVSVKTIEFGSKNAVLLRGLQHRYGGTLKRLTGQHKFAVVYRGQMKDALLHKLTPYLDGKVDEIEWVRGYLAGGLYIGKSELILRRSNDVDLIQRVKTVLERTFPLMQLRGGKDLVGIYRVEDRAVLLQWLHLDHEEEEEDELDVEKENACASIRGLVLLNAYRIDKNIKQKFPRISPSVRQELIYDLQRTDPVLTYKELAKYGCSTSQIAYLVQTERKKGTVFPIRRVESLPPNIEEFIQKRYDSIVQNPNNITGVYSTIIRDEIKREFGVDVELSMVRHIARVPWR